uniref:Disease resistance N-terminal domain-containing protein n=1 Tax=Arundo donax TaxID=35708 RepID=A0A0A8YG58_ARUDO
MWLLTFLRDADTRRRAVSDEITRVWLQQTRDAVFDAEDALDYYHLHLHKSSSCSKILTRRPSC